MPEHAELLRAGDLDFLDEEALAGFIAERRWFGARQRAVAHANVLDAIPVSDDPPLLCTLAEVRFENGARDIYQLLLGLRPVDGPAASAIWPVDGSELYDAFEDPHEGTLLLDRFRDEAVIERGASQVSFHLSDGAGNVLGGLAARPAGREQTNTSVVFGDRMILKCYRRLEAGINPELEVLRFLAARSFPHTPRLLGWFAHEGAPLDATLGMLQEFRSGTDGWELTLGALRAGEGDTVLPLLTALGGATGHLHATLASEHADPAFVPEEVNPEGLALMSAALDELTAEVFGSLPPDLALAEIAGRGDEVRDRMRVISKSTGLGRKIRVHGDLHLGQGLWSDGTWSLIDFEGEPSRPVNERRRKRSPLRDVAGLLRSVGYAAGAAQLLHGVTVPAGWTLRAREAVLDGYFAVVEPTGILPPSSAVTNELLALYELEKAVYELRYELEHRPDWVSIPARAIAALLDGER